MMVHFQERGSYRRENVVDALRWGLPQAATSEDSIVVLLDWFSAHLSPEVLDCLRQLGHVPLYHGGGVTGVERGRAGGLLRMNSMLVCLPTLAHFPHVPSPGPYSNPCSCRRFCLSPNAGRFHQPQVAHQGRRLVRVECVEMGGRVCLGCLGGGCKGFLTA